MSELNELNELNGVGNTIQPRARFRRACFTLNNYSEEELNSITHQFGSITKGYIIGLEISKTGTPHLQGYVEFEKQLYWSSLAKINKRIHWKTAYGNRESNIIYCSKEILYENTFPLKRNERLLLGYDGVIWHDWQSEIIDIINTSPDCRTIHWYWDRNGNTGKSFLSKYLVLKHSAIIADGKKDNIFNQIKTWMDNHRDDEDPKIIISDIPRHNIEYINYGAIEQIKNGMIYSGKYEGGICLFESPHVFVFANEPPDQNRMSFDRWKIRHI